MNIQELGTAMRYKVPVIVCILNNQPGHGQAVAGPVLQRRYSYTDISLADFVKLAEAWAVGMRVLSPIRSKMPRWKP